MSGPANEEQVGGDHYKHPGEEEHWDRAIRLRYDPLQYIITKWVERWRDKGGIQDLLKAQHAIAKYIEVVREGKIQGAEHIRATNPLLDNLPLPEELLDIMPNMCFVYEGGTAKWDLWTCKYCGTKLTTVVGGAAGRHHDCRKEVDTSEPGPGYVNQG